MNGYVEFIKKGIKSYGKDTFPSVYVRHVDAAYFRESLRNGRRLPITDKNQFDMKHGNRQAQILRSRRQVNRV